MTAGDAIAFSFCIRCSYALDGLTLNGSCPECGHSIEVTCREQRGVIGSVDHVRKLASGWRMLAVGFASSILSSALHHAAMADFEITDAFLALTLWVFAIAYLVSWLCAAVASWRIHHALLGRLRAS